MTLSEKIDIHKANLLKSRGWFQWYHPDYWVNIKYVPKGADYGYYGWTTEQAYEKESKTNDN